MFTTGALILLGAAGLVDKSRSDASTHERLAGLLTALNRAQARPSAPSQPPYAEQYRSRAGNAPYPRILLHQLQGWDPTHPSPYLRDRVAQLRQQGERLREDCDSDQPALLLICYFQQPTAALQARIEQRLSEFTPIPPKPAGQYGNGWLLALSYDLARAIPGFSTQAQTTTEALIATLLQQHLAILDGGGASLWHGRSTIAASAFLLASVLDLDQRPNQLLYSRSYGHFNDVVEALQLTETWPEGYNYWLQERGMPIALALSARLAQTRSAAEAEPLKQLIHRIGLWHIYLTRPDGRIEGWGDEGPRTDLREGTRRIIDILAQAARDPLLANYSRYLKTLHPRDAYYHGRLWQIILFNDPSLATLPPDKDTTLADVMGHRGGAELFGRGFSNHLVIRSGWERDATFISFRASDIFTHHQHYDAGHFTLFKGAPLIANASTNGPAFSPHRLNFAIRTIAKNSLLIVDPGEKVQPNRFFELNVIDGGQRIIIPTGSAIRSVDHWQGNRNAGPHYGAAELLAYDLIEGQAAYIQVDITEAYNSIRFDANGASGKVKRVTRELLYLFRQDRLLIRDTIITTDPSFEVRALLHTPVPFEGATQRVLRGSAEAGVIETDYPPEGLVSRTGQLRLQILAPAVSQVRQIGGEGFRYFIAEPGSHTAGGNYAEGSSTKPWFDRPAWRTEIDSSATGIEHHFVLLLSPGGGTATASLLGPAQEGVLLDDLLLWFQPDCASQPPEDQAAQRLIIRRPECNRERSEHPISSFGLRDPILQLDSDA